MLVDNLLITAAASEGEDYVVHCECLQVTQGPKQGTDTHRCSTSFTPRQAGFHTQANVRKQTQVHIV